MSKTKILVATHKEYQFPQDTIYEPIEVGVARRDSDFEYLKDSSGDNISIKNDTFCELTALYWVWKNGYLDDVEYIGLVHYRRYFRGKLNFKNRDIIDLNEIDSILSNSDIILPKRRNYYIESVYSHYKHAHFSSDLDILREIIDDISPDYLNSFDLIMNQRSLYLYNMFIISKEKFVEYCEWLFPILFELESRIDISHRDSYQKRVFGFLGERLLNVWVKHHNLSISEVKVVNLEGENLFKKGLDMIARMMSGKRRDS